MFPTETSDPEGSKLDAWLTLFTGFVFGAMTLGCLILGLRALRAERQFQAQCASLREAEERLKELSSLKKEFVAQVNHELRTPLAIIREAVSQVLEDLESSSPQQQRQILDIAVRNIDRLTGLVEELLDISKIESGRVELKQERFDLNLLLEEVQARFLPRVKERGLELRVDLPAGQIPVFADRYRVSQILSTLLNHALTFTQVGVIQVSVVHKDQMVCCSVLDSGPSIANDKLPVLFEKFDPFSRTGENGVRGTGLGLAVCKGIVELHGGTIWAESLAGQGLKVSFTLPKTEAKQTHVS